MAYIFGKGQDELHKSINTSPGEGWILMIEPKPRDGKIYEAQSNGIWLDITTPEEVDDLDKIQQTKDRWETLMGIFDGFPVSNEAIFMIIYNEIQEYRQHNIAGTLLLNIIQESGMTPTQVLNYLEPLIEDVKEILGILVGRKL